MTVSPCCVIQAVKPWKGVIVGVFPKFCVPCIPQLHSECCTGGRSSKTCRNQVCESNWRFQVWDVAVVGAVHDAEQQNQGQQGGTKLILGLTSPVAAKVKSLMFS